MRCNYILPQLAGLIFCRRIIKLYNIHDRIIYWAPCFLNFKKSKSYTDALVLFWSSELSLKCTVPSVIYRCRWLNLSWTIQLFSCTDDLANQYKIVTEHSNITGITWHALFSNYLIKVPTTATTMITILLGRGRKYSSPCIVAILLLVLYTYTMYSIHVHD